MDTLRNVNPTSCRRRQSGISLIIVLIMVVIIGLTSAAAIRNATSGERATNNIRMQNLAQQYAEAALRYCESEVSKASSDRTLTLQDANIVETAFVGGQTAFQISPAPWENAVTWTGGPGGASASKTVVPQAQLKSVDSSVTPKNLPECVAERQVMSDGGKAMVITARGFSPDYAFAAGTGHTTGGSVVWLQSILLLQ